MVITTDTSGTEAIIKKLMKQVERADETVAGVVREDSKQTEVEFKYAGNTTTRSDEKITVLKQGKLITEKATGTEVLFKEFGTGFNYGRHPLASQRGALRGGYGLGRANEPGGWTFFYDPGNAGQYAVESGSGFYFTQGQPASMPMYNSFRRLFDYIPKAIKESLL